jgi:hypothetical protein
MTIDELKALPVGTKLQAADGINDPEPCEVMGQFRGFTVVRFEPYWLADVTMPGVDRVVWSERGGYTPVGPLTADCLTRRTRRCDYCDDLHECTEERS